MQTKSSQNVPVLELNPSNYPVPAGEEHLFHCRIEIKKFDSESGKRLSIPRIQKFGAKAFSASIHTNLKKQGFTVDILHNPTEWNKEQAAKKQQLAEQTLADKETRKAEAAERAAAETQQLIDNAVAAALEKQTRVTQKLIDDAVAAALQKAGKTKEKTTAPGNETDGSK